ncbi:MAG TPA: superoxide dismutase family protein [Gemmatimonadales bacterium]|nr:superoxide dismutase family protein [Gemmatimonadales bacterium]
MSYITSLTVAGVLLSILACGPGERRAADSADANASTSAASERLSARATIAGAPGSGIEGEVRLTELEGNFPVPGVRIVARITGPPGAFIPGRHGFHIHETGKGGCTPPFTSAGGHLDAGPAGNPDPDVNHPYHTGDLPNLTVDSEGVGTLDATTSRITLSPGPLSIMDQDGSVFIVHGKPDQGISGPAKSGVSGGPRLACGLIEKEVAGD